MNYIDIISREPACNLIIQMEQVQRQYQPIAFSGDCEICYTAYELGPLHALRPEGICYHCWYQHIKTAITQISYKAGSQIISPFDGREPIDICIALKSLRHEEEVELQEFLFKKYSSFTGDIQKCPSESCDYVFTMEKCKWGMKEDQKCPKCEAMLTQSNSFDIKTVVGFIYFLFLTNKCPKCEIPIEKTTGCPHMSCPCGHQFCWYCLKDYYPTESNVYSVHEPKQCASIFVSKIIFTTICISGMFLTLLGNAFFQTFMGYFYVCMAYGFHALFLDLAVAINIMMINNLITKYYNKNHYSYYQRSNKYFIWGLLIADVFIVFVLYYFGLLLDSGIIIVLELLIAGTAALTIWGVVITVDTWFKFIC